MNKSSNRQIMVTNDDGIDSVGLHTLARAMQELGEVTVVAPDGEYSGSSASIGPIWESTPDVHSASVEGIKTAWSVEGPPALCVFYAQLGAFGAVPDLVVSGINPGANVGRAVYVSGTVGAAIAARMHGIPGVAVSQAVSHSSVEGQAWGDVVATLRYDTAAEVAQAAVSGLLEGIDAGIYDDPGVLNINVPDTNLDELAGWQWCQIAKDPIRPLTGIELKPKPGHSDTFNVRLSDSKGGLQKAGTDTAAVLNKTVALSWISYYSAIERPGDQIGAAIEELVS